jgi:hypothetical protein
MQDASKTKKIKVSRLMKRKYNLLIGKYLFKTILDITFYMSIASICFA